jgi:chromate reductase
MTERLDVVAIVGSLRRESFTRKLVHALTALTGDSMRIELLDLGGLPLFNQDEEFTPIPAVTSFRDRIRRADAVLFATPEYNRSIPGVLKNAIDTGSRPYGMSVWAGKPAAIISTSPGTMGGFGANHHLRQSLVFLDMPTLAQPEAYIGSVDKIFDSSGALAAEPTRDYCSHILRTFEAWIRLHLPQTS